MGRDLATLCCTLPEFRVGYLGRGLGNRRKFPFTLYDFPETAQWGETYIKEVWEDFSAGEDGVIITLDDASRRHWFANPHGLPDELATFLGPGRNFKKWMYLPLDSTGPNGQTLSRAATDCVMHYDRVLAASEWGCNRLKASGRTDADWLPHGIWMDKFRPHGFTDGYAPRDNVWNRTMASWDASEIIVGCVMANQSRKDFPAAFECFATLKAHYGNKFRAWLHTDEMIRSWNVYALAADYGLGNCLEVTGGLSDELLGLRYAACDCTILPSAGEGFGYPIAESLACGTACITTAYAGGAELVSSACQIAPIAYRVDTPHNSLRAVLSGYAFAQAAMGQIEAKREDWEYRSGQLVESVKHLDWNNLKRLWESWLCGGLKCSR